MDLARQIIIYHFLSPPGYNNIFRCLYGSGGGSGSPEAFGGHLIAGNETKMDDKYEFEMGNK